MRRFRLRLVALLTAPALLATGLVLVQVDAAQAATYNPGNIISDAVFFNGSAMSEAEIAAFIGSKNANCSSSSSLTCIKDYRANVDSRAADPYCGAYAGGSQLTAATIISRVAAACNINPQVLMVTLQKEQGLMTSAKNSTAYNYAMGWGCPDNSNGCSSAAAGFTYQIYKSAWQFKRYQLNGVVNAGTPGYVDPDKYKPGRTSYVLYHPTASCGGTNVYIENQATAGLYNYTPYQPNPEKLAGAPNACSSNGNYNFFTLFTSWFGSTYVPAGSVSFITAAYVDVLGRAPGVDEVNGWAAAIQRGMPRENVASGFNNSDEYRMIRIKEAYTQVLGRAAETDGAAWWLQAMQRGTYQPDDAYRTFLSTQEYYDKVAGGTDAGFLSALYEKILFRTIDQSGLDYWSAQLTAKGRAWVVDAIWFQPETYKARVSTAYQLLLGRTANDAERTYWMNVAIASGFTGMRSKIMATDEYLARAKSRYPE